MLMPASSEFVALCRSQVALLTQALKASSSVVYLTEELVEEAETKLIPIVAYPETAVVWETDSTVKLLPASAGAIAPLPRLLSGTPRAIPPTEASTDSLEAVWDAEDKRARYQRKKRYRQGAGEGRQAKTPKGRENSLQQERQIVLPLIHEGVVMGLLIASREERPWEESEIAQIERIAHTLTIARLLDQRSQWVERSLHGVQLVHSQQRDTLNNLLHQLRNPLTALRTFGKLLLRKLLPNDPNRDIANSIVRESDRVQEFLLQMDRAIDVEADELAIIPAQSSHSPQSLPLLPASSLEACSIASVLEPLILSAKAIATDRQLVCRAEIPPDLPPVLALPKALREVLSNLIDNALKYTPAGGQIYIKVGMKAQSKSQAPWRGGDEAESPPSLAIAVSDTGPGIPPEDLQHIFERHYRGVQAKTDIPGTGLGLAIARELVEQMQGEIQVFSPAERQWLPADAPNSTPGSTFIIWLQITSQVSNQGQLC